MSAGQRGLLAFWMGGAAAPPVTTTAGVRGLLAPWMGGASAPAASGVQAGYRGLMGFWAGGFGAGAETQPQPSQATPQNVYGSGDLAEQVARGERGSGGWWGYVAPRTAPSSAGEPAAAKQPTPADPPLASAQTPARPVEIALDLEQLGRSGIEELARLLPAARSAEEAAMIVAMVLGAPPPAPTVSITAGAPPATDDEFALLSLLMAAASKTKH